MGVGKRGRGGEGHSVVALQNCMCISGKIVEVLSRHADAVLQGPPPPPLHPPPPRLPVPLNGGLDGSSFGQLPQFRSGRHLICGYRCHEFLSGAVQ